MSYSLLVWVEVWQIFIPKRLELLKTHHCVLLGKISFVFFFGRIIGLKEPVWLCLTFNVIFFIFIHRKYTRSTHNNPLTRKTSSSCMVYAPLETQYITDKYFWKDVPCDVKAPFICKHNSDLLGFHKLRLSLFGYLVASNHIEKKNLF